MATIEKAWASLEEKISTNKNTKYFVLNIFTGHGMSIDGSGALPVNEYNEATHFYKMYPFEQKLRSLAICNANSYHLGVFVLCRMTFKVEDYYYKCFSSQQAQEKLKEYIEQQKSGFIPVKI